MLLILLHSLLFMCRVNSYRNNNNNNKGKGKEGYPSNRPRRPIRLWHVEAPTLSLDSRVTDGGKIVTFTRRPHFTPQEDSWYSFLLEAESTQGP
jgi:hypothetical protein